MEAETLLPIDVQPSGEMASLGRPCGACMAPEVGALSGTAAQSLPVVFNPTRIREVDKAALALKFLQSFVKTQTGWAKKLS